MAKPALNILTATLAGATVFGSLVTSTAAEAASLTYDFTVNVTSGNNIGNYKGNFSFDPTTPIYKCDSTSIFYCADSTRNNLQVSFNFLGQTFTERNDQDYSSYPRVYFQINSNNQYVLNGLSFLVLPPTSSVGFFILGSTFTDGNQPGSNPYVGTGGGTVSYAVHIPGPGPGPKPCEVTNSCSAVPEPSEVAGSGLAIGLLGLGLYLRRRFMAARPVKN